MECGAMHFGEFNPLDVLATAATLQTSHDGEGGSGAEDEEEQGEEDGEDGPKTAQKETFVSPSTTTTSQDCHQCSTDSTAGAASSPMPRVVKVVNNKVVGTPASKSNSNGNRPVVTLRDSSKIMVTGKDGTAKTLTVLRIQNKSQNPDHSYAVYTKAAELRGARGEDDEGYCSRSSLGSPGQCWKSDSENIEMDVFEGSADCDGKAVCVLSPKGTGSGLRSPAVALNKSVSSGTPSDQLAASTSSTGTVEAGKVNGASKKPTKIVIVSRDANIHKLFAHPPNESTIDVQESPVRADTNIVEKKDSTKTELALPMVTGLSEDLVELSPTTGLLSVVRENDGISAVKETGNKCTNNLKSCHDCGKSDEIAQDNMENNTTKKDSCDHSKVEDACCIKTLHSRNEQPSLETDKDVKTDCMVTLVPDSPGLSCSASGGKKIVHITKEVTSSSVKEDPTVIISRGAEDCNTETQTDVCLTDVDHAIARGCNKDNNVSDLEEEKSQSPSSDVIHSVCDTDQTTTIEAAAPVVSCCGNQTEATKTGRPSHNGSTGSSCATSVTPREHSLSHKLSSTTTTISSDGLPTVETPGERKPQQQQSSHKMLQGLLAAGRLPKPTIKPTSQTVLLPAGHICKLTNSTSGQTTPSPTNNKAGIVYLVSSNQPASAVTTAGKVSLVDKSQVTKASNQYIIQDDVPPVAKFSSPSGPVSSSSRTPIVPAIKATSSSKLCAVQPRGIAPKDSWVVIKSGVPLASKGQTTNLVTMGPAVRNIVPAGATCTMVPLLVSGGNSSITKASKSLLPIAAKVPPNNGKSSPSPVLCTQSILNKAAIIQPKPSDSSAAEFIPVLCDTPSSSSHTPPPTSSLDDSPAEESLSLDKDDNASLSGEIRTTTKAILDIKTRGLLEPDEANSDTETLSKSEADDAPEPPISGTLTPVTPASGQTTPAYEGRMTPLGFTSSSSDSSPSPGGGKINIKISGGVVVDVQQERGPSDSVCMAKRSIGQVGSLSWQGMSPLASPALAVKATLNASSQNRPKVAKPLKSELALQLKKRKKLKLKASNPSKAELFRMRECAQSMSELHPLIDHDYCMFTEFSADIQSSIIATTESKLKTEKKSVKKSKAARTKTLDDSPSKPPAEMPKLKKRKYTKRKLNLIASMEEEDALDAEAEQEQMEDEDQSAVGSTPDLMPTTSSEGKKSRERRPKRRYRPRNSGDKNYVKIPGSYQDQFVYYATKKNRGRPRKFEGDISNEYGLGLAQQTKSSSAPTNISEFEWYKEMARIDKGTKFGVELGAGNGVLPQATSLSISQSGLSYGSHKATTPIHESEVVDMVMDMMPSADMEHCQSADSNKILGDLMHTDEDTKSVCSLTPGLGEDSNHSTLRPGLQSQTVETVPPPEEGTVDANLMAEFHKLLNSMEESEIKLLANQVDSSTSEVKSEGTKQDILKEDADGTLNNLNAYLGSYSQENSVAEAPMAPATNSQFLDLDEINDSDLLNTAELGNMSAIFGDLTTSGSTATSTENSGIMATTRLLDSPTKLPASHFASFVDTSCSETYSIESNSNLDLPNNLTPGKNLLSAFGKPLDKTELFPDISAPVTPATTEFSGAPELTLVNMYWNDLPGLLVNGQEYVRLVDIHKQVLPAKDTGILKKRCQMMGLEIQNCSELQRDFLIRYMNAAKSKSCVIVQKEAAKTLIGFYVDPRPRMVNKQASSEDSPAPQSAAPWRDEDTTSSTEMVTTVRDPEAVNVCDEEVELPKKSTSGAKSKSWTMHDHSLSKTDQRSPKPTSATEPKIVKTKAIRTPGHSRASGMNNKATTPDAISTQQLSSLDLKRSARLKNKKVQYAALHSGVWADGEDIDKEATLTNSKPKVLQMEDSQPVKAKVTDKEDSNLSDGPLTVVVVGSDKSSIITKPRVVKVPLLSHRSRIRNQADELELRKLITKQKKQKLSPKEKRRIRRLREKIRHHEARFNADDARWLKERREKLLRNLEKAKLKRQEEKAAAAKYTREHCYAAHPSVAVVDDCSGNSDVVTEVVEEAMPEDIEPVTMVLNGIDDKASNTQGAGTSEEQVTFTSADDQPSQVDQDTEPTDHTEVRSEQVLADSQRSTTHVQTLRVVHRDGVQRGQRGRTQEGVLHMARYISKEAPCIQCSTCDEYLSVRRFLKHRHHLKNRDELVEVSLPQKLEPYRDDLREGDDLDNDGDKEAWDLFTHKRQMFAITPTSRRSRTPRTQKSTGRRVERKIMDKKERLREVQNKDIPEPPSSDPDLTPGSSVRHSGRTRKRKQLHPMESYVFARPLSQGDPEQKRSRKHGGRRREQGLG